MRLCMLQTALRVPGGNQVDGLPPARHTETVAKRASRGGCTAVRRAKKKQFLKNIHYWKCCVNDRNSFEADIEVYRNGTER